MKKLLGTAMVLFLTLFTIGWIGIPSATAVPFVFDPNDLLDLYPATIGPKQTQPNARRVHQTWANTYYGTFNNYMQSGHTQPSDYNTYMNWRDSLGAGEGISAFNIWLLDNPRARSWGEQVVWDPLGPTPTATADSGGLWNVQVIDNPWGTGYLVQWWTDDPNYYLRPGGTDIGEFSFSGTAYWDNNQNGYDPSDPMVQVGEYARIWFGCWNGDCSDYSIHFDSSDPGSFAANDSSGWEGVLDVPAVPEPCTMLLLGSGLACLFGIGRKRFRKMV